MHKTTIYLDDVDLKALRSLAVKMSEGNVTTLIRQAIRSFVQQSKVRPRFSFLLKALASGKTSHLKRDGVQHQRRLRAEWE